MFQLKSLFNNNCLEQTYLIHPNKSLSRLVYFSFFPILTISATIQL